MVVVVLSLYFYLAHFLWMASILPVLVFNCYFVYEAIISCFLGNNVSNLFVIGYMEINLKILCYCFYLGHFHC